MPGLSGIKILEQLCLQKNKNLAKRPVLMLTNRSDADTIIKAIRSGASDYLVKPFKKSELLFRIEKLLFWFDMRYKNK